MTGTPKKLPASNLRPVISSHLQRHRSNISSLNDFYWAAQAGFHTLKHAALQGARKTDDFLPPAIGSHWSRPVGAVAATVDSETQRLRLLFIVQSVTYYEDYLSSILFEHLTSAPLPDRKPRLQIDLASLPSGIGVEQFIRPIYAKSAADDIMSENYSKRSSRLHNILEIDPQNTDPALPLDLASVSAAGEVRNCVVHCGGIADARAVANLKTTFPTVALGAPLVVDEPTTFKLSSALKDHVEAVDLLVRL